MKITCPNCNKIKAVKKRERGQQIYCSDECSHDFSKVKITQAFRNRLANYMIYNSISIEQMGYICGVSHTTIWRILDKDYDKYWKLYTIDKVCCGMGEPMAYLELRGELLNKYFIRQFVNKQEQSVV